LDQSLILSNLYTSRDEAIKKWRCDRCAWNFKNKEINFDPNEHRCCLCLLKGGPLKLDEDNRKWFHVTCALCVDGVNFKNVVARSSINVPISLYKRESELPSRCIYCEPFSKLHKSIPLGITVKCQSDSCNNRFHVTCAYVYGDCFFKKSESSKSILIYCHKHAECEKLRSQVK
jgi:hypothetical protein